MGKGTEVMVALEAQVSPRFSDQNHSGRTNHTYLFHRWLEVLGSPRRCWHFYHSQLWMAYWMAHWHSCIHCYRSGWYSGAMSECTFVNCTWTRRAACTSYAIYRTYTVYLMGQGCIRPVQHSNTHWFWTAKVFFLEVTDQPFQKSTQDVCKLKWTTDSPVWVDQWPQKGNGWNSYRN